MNTPPRLVESPCAVCGAADDKTFLDVRDLDVSPEVFRVARCQQCGLLYLNPRPAVEDLLRYYPKDYHAYEYSAPKPFLGDRARTWRTTLKAAVLRWRYGYPLQPEPSALWMVLRPCLRLLAHWLMFFPNYVPKGSLLEVGCSTGAALSAYRELGWKVRGVEFHPDASLFARERLGLDVSTGTLAQARLPDEAFDVAILTHVLEHLPDPLETLRELRRTLKPGGSLYLAVPNLSALEPRVFGRHFAWEIPRHLYYFTPKTLGALLDKAGFEVRETQFELFGNSIDFSMSVRNVAAARGWTSVERILRGQGFSALVKAYAPVGAVLALAGFGTRFRIRAEKL